MDLKVEQLANGIMVMAVSDDGKQETFVFNDANDAGEWFREQFRFGIQSKATPPLRFKDVAPQL